MKPVECKAKWLRYGRIEGCSAMTRAKDGICPGHKGIRPLKVQIREWRSIMLLNGGDK